MKSLICVVRAGMRGFAKVPSVTSLNKTIAAPIFADICHKHEN